MRKPEDFDRIVEIANGACLAAQRLVSAGTSAWAGKPWGAVNWGDLGCVDVEIVVARDGSWRWLVHIEEVSPDAAGLLWFLHDTIRAKLGTEDCEVRLSW